VTINISCPHCGVKNRIPEERIADSPKCGRCKETIFTGKPLVATDANWSNLVLECDLPVVVDCWAAWCGPCKAFAPVFEQAAGQLEPRYRLVKLDTESNPVMANKLVIRSIPTLIVFKDGKELTRQSGAMPLNSFLQWARNLG